VVRRALGLLLFLAWLLLVILTPLRHADVVLAVGLAFYACGLTGFVVALFNYANALAGQPTGGATDLNQRQHLARQPSPKRPVHAGRFAFTRSHVAPGVT